MYLKIKDNKISDDSCVILNEILLKSKIEIINLDSNLLFIKKRKLFINKRD
jgi:hypothetical protein